MASERKTIVTYKGDGLQKVFAFPFDYLRKSFIKATIDEKQLTYGTDYTVSDKQLTFTNAPVLNAIIVIYRETTTDRLVVWEDASVLRASDMTLFEVQLLHVAEETQDKVQEFCLAKDDNDGIWDARLTRIKNVLDPVDALDVLNKRYFESVQAGFIQASQSKVDQATAQANFAQSKANDASASASAARTSELNAKASETAAKASENAAKTSETNAKASENAAKTSKTNAANSASQSANSATNAANSASQSANYATNAANSATNAANSATNAANSASVATDKARIATSEADRAKTEADRAEAEADRAASIANAEASIIKFTPSGNISAMNVQDAIVELDTEKLNISDADDFVLKAGDTMTGALATQLSNVKVYKNLASYGAMTGTVYGTCKITLPKSWSSTRMYIVIRGYKYDSNGASVWTLCLGGYNYIGDSAWRGTSAYLTGSSNFINKVRFGHDGTNCCILINNTTTTWESLQVYIDTFIGSFRNYDSGWDTGWDISFITDETGITITGNPTINRELDADTVDGKHAGNSANNVLVLDANGKVPTENLPTINADTFIKPALNASGDAPIYACRAWVNFDGTTTPPTIRASGNISSVTKNGIGKYTVNFTTPMPHSNYSATTNTDLAGGNDGQAIPWNYQANFVCIFVSHGAGEVVDGKVVSVSIHC